MQVSEGNYLNVGLTGWSNSLEKTVYVLTPATAALAAIAEEQLLDINHLYLEKFLS